MKISHIGDKEKIEITHIDELRDFPKQFENIKTRIAAISPPP